ncbi:MAG: hypothetical protein WCC36_12520 [Gammaproteobacteria bacterium]
MNWKFARARHALLFVPLALLSTGVSASLVTFTLDPSRSSLTLEPTSTRSFAAAAIDGQGGAGLRTSYSGTLSADVTAGHITLLGASLTAADSGNWSPGTGPANYGFNVAVSGLSAQVALRDLKATGSSGAMALSGGAFDATGVQWALTDGTASGDMQYSGATGSGMATPTADLTGLNAFNGAGGGTLAPDGTLTLPVDWALGTLLNGVPVIASLQGSLVATSSVATSAVPVPGAMLLMATGLIGLGATVGRRRR